MCSRCVLSTFGAPCPDCQWAQPPFATVAKRYSHMNDTMIFGMLNTAKVRESPALLCNGMFPLIRLQTPIPYFLLR